MTDDFSVSFPEARAKFLAAAEAADATLHSYGRDDIRGADGEPLSCDVAVLGDEDAERAAIVVTGTHGAEGFCGSAILHHWLTRPAEGVMVPGVKLVLVHAINPWGFSHKTRTTENNVDLNRNFLASFAGGDNPAYDRVAPFLHAETFDAAGNLAAHRAYKAYLDAYGWHLENEILAGQSHRPEGMFYSGASPEWSNRTFRRILREHLGESTSIGFIDWHTGVGAFGEVVFLVFDAEGSAEHRTASTWWGLDRTSGGAFRAGTVPAYRGLLCQAIRQESAAPRIAGAVVEFGTADDFGMFRGDRLDRWLRFEGRGDPDHAAFSDDYRKACCPEDVAWRKLVLDQGPKIISTLVTGVRDWT
jgi:hypothetical protein